MQGLGARDKVGFSSPRVDWKLGNDLRTDRRPSHTAEQVKAAEPDWIVKDLDSVRIVGVEEGLVTLEFSNGLAELPTENGDSTASQ